MPWRILLVAADDLQVRPPLTQATLDLLQERDSREGGFGNCRAAIIRHCRDDIVRRAAVAKARTGDAVSSPTATSAQLGCAASRGSF